MWQYCKGPNTQQKNVPCMTEHFKGLLTRTKHTPAGESLQRLFRDLCGHWICLLFFTYCKNIFFPETRNRGLHFHTEYFVPSGVNKYAPLWMILKMYYFWSLLVPRRGQISSYLMQNTYFLIFEMKFCLPRGLMSTRCRAATNERNNFKERTGLVPGKACKTST